MGLRILKKFLLAIPARLSSTRLPNKILADINGKPMLQHVLERCSKVERDIEIVVCTDSDQIVNLCKKLGYKYLLTSEKCNSGTERIASVINKLVEIRYKIKIDSYEDKNFQEYLDSTVIINVQGDQPLINPKIIEKMIDHFLMSKNDIEVITPIYKLKSKDIHNPNIVKALIRSDNKVIYFSRSPLPYIRDIPKENWCDFFDYWGHVGIYGFYSRILKDWFNLPKSKLENLEKLEQLRLIEAGKNFSVFKIEEDSISVDTPEQLDLVKKLMTK